MVDMNVQVGSFEWAMLTIKSGGKVARVLWGEGPYLTRNQGDTETTNETILPYIELHHDNNMVPWVCSQEDVEALDWIEKDEGAMLVIEFTTFIGENSNTGLIYGGYRDENSDPPFGKMKFIINKTMLDDNDIIEFTTPTLRENEHWRFETMSSITQ